MSHNKVGLITGILGQDGSYLTEFLLKKGYKVIGVKKRSNFFNVQLKNYLMEVSKDSSGELIIEDGDLTDTSNINALLKIIEEPLNNDYFFLINNKTQNIIETIKSRCVEFKIDMNFKGSNNNIQEFLKNFELKSLIDYDYNLLTPGLFLRFNQIMYEYNLNLNDTIYENFQKILNNHKRNKLSINIDLMKYIINFYFEKENKSISKFQIIKIIDELFNYNLSQKTFLETVKNI